MALSVCRHQAASFMLWHHLHHVFSLFKGFSLSPLEYLLTKFMFNRIRRSFFNFFFQASDVATGCHVIPYSTRLAPFPTHPRPFQPVYTSFNPSHRRSNNGSSSSRSGDGSSNYNDCCRCSFFIFFFRLVTWQPVATGTTFSTFSASSKAFLSPHLKIYS